MSRFLCLVSYSLIPATCYLLLVSCDTTKPQQGQQKQGQSRNRQNARANKQDTEANEMQVSMFLYHSDEANSQLYYNINNNQVLYKRSDTTGDFIARVKIFYKLLPNADSKSFFDSATVYVEDRSKTEPQSKYITGSFPVKVNATQPCYIELQVSDVNSKRQHTHYIKCDKTNPYTQQNYLLMGSGTSIYYSNKIERGSNITVYNARVPFSRARVDFFVNDYSLPPPPFSPREPAPYPSIPDSTFYATSLDGHSIPLKVAKRGVYFIRLDSATNLTGCTVMGVEQYFPKVLSHTQMIAATRFILNKDEYQKLTDAQDKQAAIENFWLGLAGDNQDKAKELIKNYYNRVQDANTFFTSHIEGWKTDMGMVYIVFGTPTKTYKTPQLETWVYGKEGTPNSATFKFEKINNPFSERNYKLIRNESYKYAWTVAVSNLRAGHFYLDKK